MMHIASGTSLNWWVFTGFCCFFLSACRSQTTQPVPAPKGYDFSVVEKRFLPDRLQEISGIAFFPQQDTLLKAVNDEEGKLYTIQLNATKKKAVAHRFAERGDYEDIAWHQGTWVVLRSDGALYALSDTFTSDTLLQPVFHLPEAEYEAMASTGDTLWVISKDRKQDKKGTASVFALMYSNGTFAIVMETKLQTEKSQNGKTGKPLMSAMARHPATGEWYVLSHLNKGLWVMNGQFEVADYFPLKRPVFEQPEGIAFNKRGDLCISSEGVDDGPGYILVFPYQPQQ